MKTETQRLPDLPHEDVMRRDWVQSTTTDTFAKLVLEGEGPIAVEFMSYGCAHCQVIEPVLQQVAAMVKSNEKIFRVNIAVEPELAERYEIQGTPTLIMFSGRDGSWAGRGAEASRFELTYRRQTTIRVMKEARLLGDAETNKANPIVRRRMCRLPPYCSLGAEVGTDQIG